MGGAGQAQQSDYQWQEHPQTQVQQEQRDQTGHVQQLRSRFRGHPSITYTLSSLFSCSRGQKFMHMWIISYSIDP